MSKKIKLFFVILLIVMGLCACSQAHQHTWDKYVDYDSEYHFKICSENSSHQEKERHVFDEGRVTQEATKQTIGYIEYQCTLCNKKITKTIPTLGNTDYKNKIADEKFLKTKISEATAIYYMSTDTSGYGNDDYTFEYSSIPDGYIEVEYIETVGKNSIDTGVIARSGLEAEIKYSANTVDGKQCFLGAQTDTSLFQMFYLEKTEYGISYGETFKMNGAKAGKTETVRCKLCKNEQTFSVNNTVLISQNVDSEINLGKNLFLFCSNGTDANNINGKIYYCKIWENGILVRNFIPVVRTEDGKIGLFDTIGGVFYSNILPEDVLEKNNFIGGELSEEQTLPEEYEQLTYIESSGTQYIDTKVSPTKNTSTEIVMTPNLDHMKENAIFGATWSNYGYLLICYHDEQNLIRFHSQGKVFDAFSFSYNTPNTIKTYAYSYKNHSLNVNGINIELSADNDQKTDKTNTIHLFDSYKDNCLGYFKCFSFKIYQNTKLVRNFVPARRCSDGAVGLYDTVDKIFYPSEESAYVTTSSFNKGKEVDSEGIPSEYQALEYIESTGKEYINTGVICEYGTKSILDWQILKNSMKSDTWYTAYGYSSSSKGYPYSIWLKNSNISFYRQADDETTPILTTRHKMTLVSNALKPGGIYVFCNGLKCGKYDNMRVNYRLFGLQIYNPSGLLVRDYVPVQRLEDGSIGLYDKVYGVFYENEDIPYTKNHFTSGDYFGHEYEKIIKQQPTYNQPGYCEYVCKYCNKTIIEEQAPLSYSVNFSVDEGIQEIQIINSADPNNYSTDLTAYTRNIHSYNFSRFDANICFRVIYKEGYEIDSINNCAVEQNGDIYSTAVINSDLTIDIITKRK